MKTARPRLGSLLDSLDGSAERFICKLWHLRWRHWLCRRKHALGHCLTFWMDQLNALFASCGTSGGAFAFACVGCNGGAIVGNGCADDEDCWPRSLLDILDGSAECFICKLWHLRWRLCLCLCRLRKRRRHRRNRLCK